MDQDFRDLRHRYVAALATTIVNPIRMISLSGGPPLVIGISFPTYNEEEEF